MQIALYARVSTRDKGQDTENQLVNCESCQDSGMGDHRRVIDHATGKHSDGRFQKCC